LQEKPRSLLMALVQRRGELVSRKQLREHLWPNDTFVDFEEGLNAAMSKLREALDDDSQSPRFIETVRGRGYRFIAKVETIKEEEQAVPLLEARANCRKNLARRKSSWPPPSWHWRWRERLCWWSDGEPRTQGPSRLRCFLSPI
jgi:DNA-binding winged helix-turn-helix (wHTH) protein